MTEIEKNGGLLDELKRLAAADKTAAFNVTIDIEKLPPKEQESARLLDRILKNCKAAAEYDLIKYKLINNSLGIAHWDMDVVYGDPVNPDNKFTWSREFRRMLGFSGESDFPNVMSSFANRLHPEDKDRVISGFAAHITDLTGQTPYNLEYRLLTKNGEYRHFHAVGMTLRDEAGTPLKVAGALEDITGRVRQQEMLENILNAMDSYIYTTDIETDEILFVNKKMIGDFRLGENARGDKCWRYFQRGQPGRCPWCRKDELLKNPGGPVIWEEDNPVSGNSLYKIDRIIDWPGGRKVHMQQCMDITAMKRAREALIEREKMLNTLNNAAIIILSRKDEAFEEAMTEGVNLISGIAGFDRMSLFRNHEKPDGLHSSQIYRWSREAGGSTSTLPALADNAYADLVPRWEAVLASGECINGPVRLSPEAESLGRFGCVTVLAVPVLTAGVFWGHALFENLREEKRFSAQEIDILRPASFMLANAVTRNEEAQKIREAHEYAKLMLDATPLACRLWNREFELIECNEAAVKLFGLKNKQEYLDRYFDLSPEYQSGGRTTRDRIREVVARAFETGEYTCEWMYLTLDGTPVPSEITLVRVPYGDDYVVASYSRDLREQKKMMAEIEQRDHLLQTVNQAADILLRSEPADFLNTLYQCMGMMTRAVNAGRMYIHKNYIENEKMYHTRIYEWRENMPPRRNPENGPRISYEEGTPVIMETFLRGECVNMPVRGMNASDRERLGARGILSVLLIPVFIRDTFWGFVGFNNRRGETLFSENEVSVMRSGSLLVVNALLRNESMLRIRDTSTQLETALVDAERANSAKSRFLAHMSHEIRTPLNAVIGLSELTLGQGDIGREAESNLEKIYGAGATILSIVNDILDISKIEFGKLETYPVQYDTPSLVNDVVTLNIVRIGEKSITFKLFLDENLPGVLFGDDLRVKQIFNNLLSNAFKYTNAGTVEWRITFEREGDSVWIISSVRDTGIGIKPEGVRKLFTDYNQVDTKTNRNVEGTGLGLAITKRLVEMMGGNISVESEYGKGSVFHVRLRQAFVSDTPIGKTVADNLMGLRYTLSKRAKNTKLARIDLSYAHVLVVDDIDTNLDVVKGMLKPYGIKVDCVSGGRQAVEMIRAENVRYSAVFMDHMMPGMDGIEAARIIRGEIGTDYARNVPIIALTANAIVGNEEMFLEQGFQDFISKPIDLMKLDAVLRRWVRDKDFERDRVTGEYAGAPRGGNRASLPKGITINGMDMARALDRFSGDEAVFIDVLRSYAANTPRLLDKLREYLAAENFSDYAIAVHGIKGASYGLLAREAGRAAEALESAAREGRHDAVRDGHAAFEKTAGNLLDGILAALGEIDAAVTRKPPAAAPDPALLDELREACAAFDMNRVDKAMERLEALRYERGENLVTWLREQVNNMTFEEISGGVWPFE